MHRNCHWDIYIFDFLWCVLWFDIFWNYTYFPCVNSDSFSFQAFNFGEQDILFQNFTWVSVLGAPFEIVFCSTNLKSKASKLNFFSRKNVKNIAFECFQDQKNAVFIMLSVFFSTSYILLLRPFNLYEFEGVDYFTNLPHPYSHSYQKLAKHCRF